MVPKVGELLRVTVGTPERQNAKWLETGDIVRVVSNHQHIFVVEKLKEGKDGYKMRQSFQNCTWKMNLERLVKK